MYHIFLFTGLRLLWAFSSINDRMRPFTLRYHFNIILLIHVGSLLATAAIPSDKDVTGKEVPAICIAYCILMNQRWKELSLLQKINSVALGSGHATEKVQYVSLVNLLL